MEVRSQLHTTHADWVQHSSGVVYRKLLRNDVNNLVAGRNVGLILVAYEQVNVVLSNDIIGINTYAVATCLNALDMLTGNANVNFIYFKCLITVKAAANRFFNALNALVNI